MGGADVIRSAYPIRDHFWSIVRRGELPTWSPYLMGGYPIFIEEQASPFYPTEWLFGLFRSPAAYNLAIGWHAWFAGLGAYVLARKLQMSRLAAWMVVVIAVLGAPLTARVAAGHPSHFFGRTLMIWVLVAVLQLAENPGWWSALGIGVVFGSQLLIGIGNYQTTLYTALVSILFAVFLLASRVPPPRRWGFLLWGFLGLAIAVGLGLARMGPTIDIGLQSSRQGGLTAESLNYGALPPIMIAGYIFPHVFDDPSITDYTWPEFALYVGSAPALLALYGAFKRRREPVVRLWGLITLLFLLLSLGDQGGLFPLFARYVPGYQFFRNPARHGMVTGLGVMMLAGYGFDALGRGLGRVAGESRGWNLRYRVAAAVGGLFLLVLAGTYQESSGPSIELLPERLVRGVIWFTAAIAVFYLAYRTYRYRPGPILAVLVVGVVALDLTLYAYPQIYRQSTPAELPYVVPGNFPGIDQYGVAFLESGSSADWALVNVAANQGVRLINMYTGVVPLRMARLINLVAGRSAQAQHEQNQILLDRIGRPDLLDYLGVRYLLISTERRMDEDSSLRYRRALGTVNSYENVGAMPFAFVVSQTTAVQSPEAALEFVAQADDLRLKPAAIEGAFSEGEPGCPEGKAGTDLLSDVRLEGGNLRFVVGTSAAGMLTINQTYQRGWQGWVDGEPTPVYPVNYRWMGVYLPCPGAYDIHLRYLPTSLLIGLAVSASSLVLVLMVSLVVARRSQQLPFCERG